jgi:hypothetical protein
MKSVLLALPLLFFSCYQAPKIEGFSKESWQQAMDCEHSRLEEARTLLDHESYLLSANQNEIKALLGDPDEHELYGRNQKFFYYDLVSNCDSLPAQRLSLRFDALGRLKELNVFFDDK